MSINSAPSMKHRIVGKDAQGVERRLSFESKWKATQEAKNRIQRGWSDLTVETWDKNHGQFLPNEGANDELYKVAETRREVDEDALEAISGMRETTRSLYTSYSKGTASDEDLVQFLHESVTLLIKLGFSADDVFNASRQFETVR